MTDVPHKSLPPITSSQTRASTAAQTVCKGLGLTGRIGENEVPVSGVVTDKSELPEEEPKSSSSEMTLADLESLLTEDDEDEVLAEAGWDAKNYRRKTTPAVRREGASLAGAALRKMKK